MARKNAQPDEEIIDLTELIESGAPAKSAAKKAYGDAPVSAPPDDDFESLLAGAEAADGKKANSRPVDPNEQLDMSDMGDIDNLLESLDIPPQPAERQAPPPAEEPEPAAAQTAPEAEDDLDSVLDDLLGAGDPQPAPRETSQPAPQPEAPEPDIDADLDNILSSFDEDPKPAPQAPPQPAPAKKQEQAAGEINLDAELDGILAEMDAQPAKAPKPAAPATPPPAPEDAFPLPEDLDGLLDEPQPTKAVPAQDLPDMPQPRAPESMVAASNMPHAAPMQTVPQELIAGICRNVMAVQGAASQDALQDFSRQLGSQGAHIEDLSRNVTDLSKRLFACESKLGAAKARVAAMEKSIASNNGIEDLIREGTPMHAGFMALIASAVSNAVQGMTPQNVPDEGLQASLATLTTHLKKMDGAIKSLEERLGVLEQDKSGDDIDQDARLASLAESERHSLDRIEALENRLKELEAEEPQADAHIPLEDLIQRVSTLETNSAGNEANAETRLAALAENSDATLTRLEELEKRLAAIPAQPQFADPAPRLDELAARADAGAEKTGEIEKRLAALETNDAGMAADVETRLAALAENSDATLTRLEELEKRLAAIPAQPQFADPAPRLDELAARADAGAEKTGEIEKRLAALETNDAGMAADVETRLAALAENSDATLTRLEELEKRLAAIPPQPQFADPAPRLDELAARADAGAEKTGEIEKRLAALETNDAGMAADVETRLAALAENSDATLTRLEELEKRLAAIPPQPQFADPAPRLDELAARADAGAEKTGEIEKRLAALETNDAGMAADVETRLAALAENSDATLTRLEELEKRLNDLPSEPQMPDLAEKIARLDALEKDLDAKMDALSGRLTSMEEQTAATGAAIEARLAEYAQNGEAASKQIAHLEKSILEAAEKAPQAGGEVEKSIKRLSTGERSARARMDSLEKRLDELEPNFNIQVEKAAATAVARILNEEIRKLSEG